MGPSREGNRRNQATGPYCDLSSDSSSHAAATGIVGAGGGRPGGICGRPQRCQPGALPLSESATFLVT
eukprot:874561-Prymnesium_polylepis.1